MPYAKPAGGFSHQVGPFEPRPVLDEPVDAVERAALTAFVERRWREVVRQSAQRA